MILISHPTGNANIRNAALALHEVGALGEFWTSVHWRPENPLGRVLPAVIRAQMARRTFPGLPAERIRATPFRELGRFAAPRLGLNCLTRHEVGCFSVDGVYRGFDRTVARRIREAKGQSAVYTVEDCAFETFQAARDRGWHRFYDLPIGYWKAWRDIHQEEVERQPEWAATLDGIQDSEAKLHRKSVELELAETVLVASSFTRQTLDLAPGSPREVHVIPYGAPPVAEASKPLVASGKLRVLFVGSLGQRKGLSYLLDAMRMMAGAAELTLLGRKTAEDCEPLNRATQLHRWIPTLSHEEVLEEMTRHDVLVFPSLFEGFGLVLLEAMSRGLPVITTAHTAGPDVIVEGQDGFIVPIRSSSALAEKLELLAADRELLAEMKQAALASARRRVWSDYRRQLGEVVLSSLPRP